MITLCQKENMNSESNILLIKKILEANPEKKRIVLVLDNAPMNKSNKVKEFVEDQNGRLDLYYLPVYSPNLNLIERLWRFSKKNFCRTSIMPVLLDLRQPLKIFLKGEYIG